MSRANRKTATAPWGEIRNSRMEPNDLVDCAICYRPEPLRNALRVNMLGADNVWLCRLCTDAVAKELEWDKRKLGENLP